MLSQNADTVIMMTLCSWDYSAEFVCFHHFSLPAKIAEKLLRRMRERKRKQSGVWRITSFLNLTEVQVIKQAPNQTLCKMKTIYSSLNYFIELNVLNSCISASFQFPAKNVEMLNTHARTEAEAVKNFLKIFMLILFDFFFNFEEWQWAKMWEEKFAVMCNCKREFSMVCSLAFCSYYEFSYFKLKNLRNFTSHDGIYIIYFYDFDSFQTICNTLNTHGVEFTASHQY